MKKHVITWLALVLAYVPAGAQADAVTGNLTSGPTLSVHGKLSTGFVESFKSGTPLFSNEWQQADFLLADGSLVAGVPVKINLANNEVYYLAGDKQYVATSAINEIRIKNSGGQETVFVNGMKLQHTPGVWYQQILTGQAALYKRLNKVIEESRQYGSATIERSISTKEQYFVYYRNVLREVNKMQELPELFFTHKAEISSFMEQKKFRRLSEAALREVVAYFNALP